MSAETTTGDQTEVVRWYTRARKFPKLIGRTHTGGKIWGGPYTITQFIAGGAVLFVGANTMGLWGGRGLFMDGAILLGLTWGVVAGVGKIPVGSRNPVTVIVGAVRACVSPKHGRLEGRPLQLARPRQVQHAIAVPVPANQRAPRGVTPPAAQPAPLTSPPSGPPPAARTAEQDPPPTSRATAPLTGVQALLASTPATSPATPVASSGSEEHR